MTKKLFNFEIHRKNDYFLQSKELLGFIDMLQFELERAIERIEVLEQNQQKKKGNKGQ